MDSADAPRVNAASSLAQLDQAINEVKNGMDMDALETALTLLKEVLHNESVDPQMKAVAKCLTMKCLTMRYAHFGWAEDLDLCRNYLADSEVPAATLVAAEMLRDSAADLLAACPDMVETAYHLLNQHRQSIDIDQLDYNVCVACEILASDEEIGASQRCQVILCLENALVLKAIKQGREGRGDLDLATDQLSDAKELLLDDDGPLAYFCSQSLGHIGWIMFLEYGDQGGINQVLDSWKQETEIDKKGNDPYTRGVGMIQGDLIQVESAVHLLRKSLVYRPTPHPRRAESLTNLCISHLARFNHTGNFQDVEDAIELSQEALDLRPPPHPLHGLTANNHYCGLWARFERTQNPDDLDDAISLCRRLSQTANHVGISHSALLHNLARGLFSRYDSKHTMEDLEEAIRIYRRALLLSNGDEEHQSSILGNLSAALRAAFNINGNFRDLEECISLGRKALLRHVGHTDHAAALDNLAGCVYARYLRRGNVEDVYEAISLSRNALKHQPSTHPSRAKTLNNLGLYLSTLLPFSKADQHLEESIIFLREAVELRPHPNPERTSSLENLAAALSDRYTRKGDSKDIAEAITLLRSSSKLELPPSPRYPTSLSNLGNALRTRFEAEGDPEDLEESISLLQKASSLIGATHYHWCTVHGSLFQTLHTKYRQSSNEEDFDSAYNVLEAVAQNEVGPLFERFRLSWARARFNRQYNRPSTLQAYRHTVGMLPSLSSLDLTLAERQSVLRAANSLANDAVRYAIERQDLETSVVFFSTARSTFWSQALQLRPPIDKLAVIDPELAGKYRVVSQRLEAASHESTAPAVDQAEEAIYPLVQQREELLSRIRNIDGLHDFLLPPTFDLLKNSATNGPVVLLNDSAAGCDAVIMSTGGSLFHVPLLEINHGILGVLKQAVQQLAKGGRIRTETIRDIEDTLSRDHRLKGRRLYNAGTIMDDDFRYILGVLWAGVVAPVIRTLKLQKTLNPQRIWWCPSGLFCFLPIHAAGDYAKEGTKDTLLDYAISSYCYTPQDLMVPLQQLPADFRFLAVIEPESTGIGAAPLPNTLHELKRIRQHVPTPENLTQYVGNGKPHQSVTNEEVLKEIRRSSFVHFGCHGVQHPEDPLKSTLLLSGGKLTMLNIIQQCQTSMAALAFLSACQTAMSDEARPDESLTLTATMMFAGFKVLSAPCGQSMMKTHQLWQISSTNISLDMEQQDRQR
ncbi:hypothetical protein FA15DRAFT_707405 [Coprinopsis marcescibilis]|uniref:CHAT domain-containing protein n=1 Tax=Coprinopsis marcescibilis TaxID=230819 RepID=A0A5C3KLV3_COPMA|nr:hypothetical protein FA15DRAFT_707405 [Coprinopsis marcescibilis]